MHSIRVHIGSRGVVKRVPDRSRSFPSSAAELRRAARMRSHPPPEFTGRLLVPRPQPSSPIPESISTRRYLTALPSSSVHYNKDLAGRLRKMLPRATEKRMFGGVGMMERGHLVAGVSHEDLIVRVPPEETDRWLAEPGAHSMMPGRPMTGWVKVAVKAVREDDALRRWVERSRDVTKALPPK